MAAFLYMGSSLGVVFSGDFLTLFVFWEIMAFTSVFLIWYRREKESLDAGFGSLLMHIFGGCCLLTGIILQVTYTGSLALGPLKNGWGSFLILIGFVSIRLFYPFILVFRTPTLQEQSLEVFFSRSSQRKQGFMFLPDVFPGVSLSRSWAGSWRSTALFLPSCKMTSGN